jgi:hypothetical protein
VCDVFAAGQSEVKINSYKIAAPSRPYQPPDNQTQQRQEQNDHDPKRLAPVPTPLSMILRIAQISNTRTIRPNKPLTSIPIAFILSL